jgi:hypothetical protein
VQRELHNLKVQSSDIVGVRVRKVPVLMLILLLVSLPRALLVGCNTQQSTAPVPEPTPPPTTTPPVPAPVPTPSTPSEAQTPATELPEAAPEPTPAQVPPHLNLPSEEVTAVHKWMSGSASEYDLELEGLEEGYDIADGIYQGWCLEDNYQDNSRKVRLYSSYDPEMPDDIKYYRDPTIPKGSLDQLVPWDKLNYMLNHKQGSIKDVGAAIFLLVWGESKHFPASPAAQAMYSDAETNGIEFIPKPGDIMAIILYKDGLGDDILPDDRNRRYQDTFIEYVVP